LIGKGTGIVGHEAIEIGDDVFTGHNVYITDASHGYEDPDTPIGRQFGDPRPVRIGAGSWLGHGTIVLPGSCIGRHVVVGAGSVVTGELPDFSVAVGNPARVIRTAPVGAQGLDVGVEDVAGDG
jgi:acetyltransferase-like isoleucine patch superfamily enzyme